MVYPKAVDYLTKTPKSKPGKPLFCWSRESQRLFKEFLLVDSQNLRVRFCC